MANTISLSELAAQVEDRERRKSDVIVDPRNLEALPPLVEEIADETNRQREEARFRVTDADRDLTVSDVAHDQVASWSPIGTRYYKRMLADAPDLWAENVNHWFHEAEKPRMLRLVDDHTRAFVSNQFGRYEDVHLLRPVLERAAERGWEVDHCALTDKGMYLRVLFPKLEGEVKVGEPVRAGAAFSNSEIGFRKMRSEFFVQVLACLNGMVSRNHIAGFERMHLTGKQPVGWLSPSTLALEDQLLQAKVADTLDAMDDERRFGEFLAQLKEGAAARIENPVQATEVLARRIGLGQDEQNTVVNEYVNGGDPTLWGLVNALTATAREVPSFERRAELELAAGTLIEQPRTWREITEAKAA